MLCVFVCHTTNMLVNSSPHKTIAMLCSILCSNSTVANFVVYLQHLMILQVQQAFPLQSSSLSLSFKQLPVCHFGWHLKMKKSAHLPCRWRLILYSSHLSSLTLDSRYIIVDTIELHSTLAACQQSSLHWWDGVFRCVETLDRHHIGFIHRLLKGSPHLVILLDQIISSFKPWLEKELFLTCLLSSTDHYLRILHKPQK